MAEIYPLGENKIFYRTRNNPNGVTVDFLDPDLTLIYTKEPLQEVPNFPRLYYFKSIFSVEGTYIAIFYEDGEEKISQAFSTRKIPTQGLRTFGSNRLINR